MPGLLRSRKWTLLSSILTLTYFLFTQVVAQAQQTPAGLVEVNEGRRRGFWLSLGVGAGGESNNLTADADYSEPFYQPTVSLRAGGTIGPRLRVGGEVHSWINEEADAVESLSSVLLIGQFYPIRSAGLYLKGGLGVGRNAVEFDDGFDLGDTGFAGLLGVGYELRLGRHVFLNPVVDFVGHSYDSRSGGDYRERLVIFGLGIVVQTAK
jgi:hypothetical protein